MSTPVIEPRAVVLGDALVRRHQRGVWRYLRFLGAAPAVADDLTQEAFLTLLRRPVEDRGDEALAAWLRTTARNLYGMHRRALRPGLSLADVEAIETTWQRHARDDDGERWLGALDRCLARLDARERRVLELRYGRGQSSRAEIAADVGLAPEGVKTLLRRAKHKLRLCIERRLAP